MGSKITIDSATLMNKGLGVHGARLALRYSGKPRSRSWCMGNGIIHSLVEYRDRSMIAQLGLPDMRTLFLTPCGITERMPLDSVPRFD